MDSIGYTPLGSFRVNFLGGQGTGDKGPGTVGTKFDMVHGPLRKSTSTRWPSLVASGSNIHAVQRKQNGPLNSIPTHICQVATQDYLHFHVHILSSLALWPELIYDIRFAHIFYLAALIDAIRGSKTMPSKKHRSSRDKASAPFGLDLAQQPVCLCFPCSKKGHVCLPC